MKKVIVSMMMAVSLIFGGVAIAQTPADGTTGATTQQTATTNDKATKDNKGGNKKMHKGPKGDKAGKGKRFNPFEGVQLTDEQQQKLQVLQQGLGPVELTPEQQANIPENKNLTPEQKKQLKEERKAKRLEAKKNYLKGVKETLTPEQYVVFLENWYLYSPQMNKEDKGHHGMKPGARDSKKWDGKGKKNTKVKKAENQ